jgi:hypothetical protein
LALPGFNRIGGPGQGSKEPVDFGIRGDYIAASADHQALNGGAGKPVRVFDIVDLERETQAAASWR